ncbi:MAG: hypothetical protein ACE5IR_17290, partial [bacterium]
RIDGREWHLEKTIDSSYDRHENYWSLSTSTKTLERAVRKNMEKLLIELFYLGKVEEAHSAYLIAHKDQSIAAYQQFLSRYGKSIFAREAQLNIGSVYTPF